jgi:hypothetical protein
VDASSNSAAPSDPETPTLTPRRSRTAVFFVAVRYALFITVPVAVIVAFFGLIPPWTVTTALVIGLIATISLVAAKKPALATTSTVATIVVCAWLLRPVVDIRAAESTDPIYDRYFSIDSVGNESGKSTIRNIAIATGIFTHGTWLSASLYHVKSGEVHEINAFTVGRTTFDIGAPYWEQRRITLALGDRRSPRGRITRLGSAGQTRGGGRSSEAVNDVHPQETRTFPMRLTAGRKRILYVEGDQGFAVDDTMTAEQFAQQNKGNYLVVEVELD